MEQFLFLLIGVAAGVGTTWLVLEQRRNWINAEREKLAEASQALKTWEQERLRDLEAQETSSKEALAAREREFETLQQKRIRAIVAHRKSAESALSIREQELIQWENEARSKLETNRDMFEREAHARDVHFRDQQKSVDSAFSIREQELIQRENESRSKLEIEREKFERELDSLQQKQTCDIDAHRKSVESALSVSEQELIRRENESRLKLEADRDTFEREAHARDRQFFDQQKQLRADSAALDAERRELDSRIANLQRLQEENSLLKRDLRNIMVDVNATEMRHDQLENEQFSQRERSDQLAARLLEDNVKWTAKSLTQHNFQQCSQQLRKAITWCRSIGYEVSVETEQELIGDLKERYEIVVRAAFEREEQLRIKAQIREEMAREKEIQREMQQLERERDAIDAALQKAIADAHAQYTDEVERLKARLSEAEDRIKRAISQAQLTKSGNVYVISNIGSFGQGVFKVGMTRRLEPMDRVRELGDASVPFPFDVHMMIHSDDAPTLENVLHRQLHKLRVNKTNPRKEFFRTSIEEIVQIVKENHGEVAYQADAEALQYRQSLEMSQEEQEFIESVYEDLGIEGEDDEQYSPD